ncbi:hypothetical protein CLM85_27010, partial [Streptomyces albidoflavus]
MLRTRDPDRTKPHRASIRACDHTADGWGIEAWPDSNRDGTSIPASACTRCHGTPYCTSWKSGNIEEGTPVTVY